MVSRTAGHASRLKLALQEFIPHPLLRNAHLQTIIADRFPGLINLPSAQEFKVQLSDGDTLINEYLPGNSNTVSFLCHGLSGDSRSKYIQRSAYYLHQLGHHVVMLNHRNCGPGFGLATKPYSSGSGKDIGEVIAALRKKFPAHKILLYGFSLSANASLTLLCNEMQMNLPDAALIVNPPINLSRCSELLNQGWNKIYERHFILNLHAMAKKLKSPVHTSPWMSIWDFDDVYTSKLSGYKDANDYYTQCSTYQKLNRITVPTLIITSDDDPFVDVADFKHVKTSSAVDLLITHGGGHLGYISQDKTPLGTHRWLDYTVAEFGRNK